MGYKTNYFTYVCESKERDIWLGFLYGYKGVLQVIALFLAFGTRKVKVKGLNDSKFIAATIYITSIVLVIEIIASITLNEYVNTFSVLFATSIFIMATVILALVFIPQVSYIRVLSYFMHFNNIRKTVLTNCFLKLLVTKHVLSKILIYRKHCTVKYIEGYYHVFIKNVILYIDGRIVSRSNWNKCLF